MKNTIKGLIFWMIVIGIILMVSGIAKVLAEVISMNFIMNIVYALLGISIVYILKNL